MKIYAIDQSLNGFAHVVMEDGKVTFTERINTEAIRGYARIERLLARVEEILGPMGQAPRFDVVVMEDYAYGANTNNLTVLAELGGCLKRAFHLRGYAIGREAILRSRPVFMVQGQGRMKKFCLGNGSTKKDSRYLLTVLEKVKQRFDNDDQADAYMHAWMASMVVGVIKGLLPLENLDSHQQEALIEIAAKSRKGLSITKALKMSVAEKQKLVEEMEV